MSPYDVSASGIDPSALIGRQPKDLDHSEPHASHDKMGPDEVVRLWDQEQSPWQGATTRSDDTKQLWQHHRSSATRAGAVSGDPVPEHIVCAAADNRVVEVIAAGEDQVRLSVWVIGNVQGVGFRWWTKSVALELGLAGWAENLSDGRVHVVAEGARSSCEELLAALQPLLAPALDPALDAALDVAVNPASPPRGVVRRTRPGSVTAAIPTWAEARGAMPRFEER